MPASTRGPIVAQSQRASERQRDSARSRGRRWPTMPRSCSRRRSSRGSTGAIEAAPATERRATSRRVRCGAMTAGSIQRRRRCSSSARCAPTSPGRAASSTPRAGASSSGALRRPRGGRLDSRHAGLTSAMGWRSVCRRAAARSGRGSAGRRTQDERRRRAAWQARPRWRAGGCRQPIGGVDGRMPRCAPNPRRSNASRP